MTHREIAIIISVCTVIIANAVIICKYRNRNKSKD